MTSPPLPHTYQESAWAFFCTCGEATEPNLSCLAVHLAAADTWLNGLWQDDEVKPVGMIYKRIESERAVAARMRSHTHMQQLSDAELWKDVEYRSASNKHSKVHIKKGRRAW